MAKVSIVLNWNELQLESAINTVSSAIDDHSRMCKEKSRCGELSTLNRLLEIFTDAKVLIDKAKEEASVRCEFE